jgi:hypothetical protein
VTGRDGEAERDARREEPVSAGRLEDGGELDAPVRPAGGEVRPRQRAMLDRAPGERYLRGARRPGTDTGQAGTTGSAASARDLSAVWPPLAVVVGGALAYTVVGGILAVTAGLVVLAAFLGWLIGKLVATPPRAAFVGLLAVVAGLAGIWLFGRLEGGVLDPVAYFDEVQGWPLVALQLLAGGGLAAAASR